MTIPTKKNPITFKILKISLKSIIFTHTYITKIPHLIHKKLYSNHYSNTFI